MKDLVLSNQVACEEWYIRESVHTWNREPLSYAEVERRSRPGKEWLAELAGSSEKFTVSCKKLEDYKHVNVKSSM